MLDWVWLGFNDCCGSCQCCKPEQPTFPSTSSEFDSVEDGDMLQEAGVQRTLQMLRQIMNQNGPIVVDNPPPDYQDFNKYPLATEYNLKTSAFPQECFADPYNNNNSETSVRSPAWNEPFPKPSGDPPPVPLGWLRNRMTSIRRSITQRFSANQRHQQDGHVGVSVPDLAVSQVVRTESGSISGEQNEARHEHADDVAATNISANENNNISLNNSTSYSPVLTTQPTVGERQHVAIINVPVPSTSNGHGSSPSEAGVSRNTPSGLVEQDPVNATQYPDL